MTYFTEAYLEDIVKKDQEVKKYFNFLNLTLKKKLSAAIKEVYEKQFVVNNPHVLSSQA